jgi:hypothetical protein
MRRGNVNGNSRTPLLCGTFSFERHHPCVFLLSGTPGLAVWCRRTVHLVQIGPAPGRQCLDVGCVGDRGWEALGQVPQAPKMDPCCLGRSSTTRFAPLLLPELTAR